MVQSHFVKDATIASSLHCKGCFNCLAVVQAKPLGNKSKYWKVISNSFKHIHLFFKNNHVGQKDSSDDQEVFEHDRFQHSMLLCNERLCTNVFSYNSRHTEHVYRAWRLTGYCY